jgi:pyruvate dehydrogenase E2 component (dihydrolipoamide acetyltransferase)
MARIEVAMPQMGESIAEGTVSKWLKNVGDAVARDEALLEISTDKVDAEIPSPVAGTLAAIAVEAGKTVEVGTVVAYIETDKTAAAEAPAPAAPAPAAAASSPPAPAPAAPPQKQPEAPAASRPTDAVSPAAPAQPAPVAATAQPDGDDSAEITERDSAITATPVSTRTAEAGERGSNGSGTETTEERLRRRSTPLVRKIAAEHGVDIGQVEGSGHAGRVTKQDIMSYLEKAPSAAAAAPAQVQPAPKPVPAAVPAGGGGGAVTGADDFWKVFYGQVHHPEFTPREPDTLEPMDRIRKLTADHMVRAKRVAPHVHSFIEIDFTQIDRVRKQNAARWEQQGAKVSFTAFVAWACAQVVQDYPMVNATISGDNILYRGNINLGIAVDLNPGLIVPVIRNADELNLAGIGKRIDDLATRARSRKLKPEEIQGATFSITNPGVLGTLVGMPIIPEGTAAILGTGAIEKRPVVVEVDGADTIAIRKRSIFSLGYDHRLVDGADAARFLAQLKRVLEAFPADA